jgi:cytochrome c biogenesis protein CcmG/thiol:disulfide interchange protein DsbE
MKHEQLKANYLKRWKLFLPLLLCLLFSVTLYFSLDKDPHALGLAQQNKPFPIIHAEDLFNPESPIVRDDLKGKIVLLNVWASWCATCMAEHNFLLELSKRPEINLYGLNYRDNREKAIKILTERSNPFEKVIFDPQGKLALELGVYGTPETYLIDEQGIIRFRYAGQLDEERWQTVFVPEIAAITNSGGRL